MRKAISLLLWSVCVAFIPVSAYAVTGTLTYSITSGGGGGGLVCDAGPNTTLPTGSLGADLSTAGYNHCALNADFSDNSGANVPDGNGGTTWVMNNPATYLDNCMSTHTGWRFFLTWGSFYVEEDLGAPSCGSRGAIVTDPMGGGFNVFHMQIQPSDITASSINSGQLSTIRLTWPRCGNPCSSASSSPYGPWLPLTMYVEQTLVFGPNSTTQQNGGIIWNWDQDIPAASPPPTSSYGWYDKVIFEMLANNYQAISGTSLDDYPAHQPGNNANCCGFTWRNTALDVLHWHTYGFLYTSDGQTQINQCAYVDGNLVAPNSAPVFGSTGYNCATVIPWQNGNPQPPTIPQNDPKWFNNGVEPFREGIGEMSSISAPFLTNTIDMYIKSIRVILCPGYRSGSLHMCTGGLVFHTQNPA